MKRKFDFAGWATRNNLRCSDGRVIRKGAFKDNDGETVPLVWNHRHDDPNNVLGHALLENRDEGVYAYCTFNETDSGKAAKLLVEHGDVKSLSIYANRLEQNGGDVLHGAIREVSLVLAGANPGAYIESVVRHGEEIDDEAILWTGEDIYLAHSDKEDDDEETDKKEEESKKEKKPMKNPKRPYEEDEEEYEEEGSGKEETVADVFNTLNEKQKKVVYALVGKAIEDTRNERGEDDDEEDDEDDEKMKHNVFYNDERENYLSHAEMEEIVGDARRIGSMKEAFIQHGINQIDYLFPDAKNVGPAEPIFVQRDMEWVNSVINNVKHTPFARTKSLFADITNEEARAKGYVKGNRKEEEVFALLKRTTTPKTVYKKQKFDRDDVLDITDLDVISWVKKEMRMMLDEEIARAILIGDGRSSISPDKIDEDKVRPIYRDDEFFSVKYPVVISAGAGNAARAKAFIQGAIRSRKQYKGSGNPIMFMTEDMLTECLLLEDANERVIYDTEEKLRTALRVSKIVTVPVLEGVTRTANGTNFELAGIYVNLQDYNVGADKGGEVNMFDDFDIDYNQQKYLIETRISGALIKPFSAVCLEFCEGEPLTLGVAPVSADTTVMGKTAKELQTRVTVFKDEISGYLNYVTGYTEYSDEESEQSGHYVALKFVIPTGAAATVKNLSTGYAVNVGSDGTAVMRVTSNTQTIRVTVTKSGETLTRDFTLNGLTLRNA